MEWGCCEERRGTHDGVRDVLAVDIWRRTVHRLEKTRELASRVDVARRRDSNRARHSRLGCG